MDLIENRYSGLRFYTPPAGPGVPVWQLRYSRGHDRTNHYPPHCECGRSNRWRDNARHNVLIRLLVLVAVCYVAFALVLYLFQDRMLFLPNVAGSNDATPEDIGLAFDEVWLETEDGERLHAWWIPHPNPRATVVFSHGNAGSIGHRLESLRIFHALELNTLIYDYRGYGRSSGRADEPGIYLDATAAWEWVVEHEQVPAHTVLLFGRSLGGAVSAWLASRIDAGGLILESTFTSVPDLGQQLYWWLPVRWLSRLEFNTREYLSSTRLPVLIVHSPNDEIVPFSHAEQLLAATDDGKLLRLAGDHNTGFLAAGEGYSRGLDRFVERVVSAD